MSVYQDHQQNNQIIDRRIHARIERLEKAKETLPALDILSYLRSEGWTEYDIKRAMATYKELAEATED